jgi:hypothetical protein
MRHLHAQLLILAVILFLTAGCGGNREAELAALPTLAVLPSATATFTPSPTVPATDTPTLTATATDTPTPTATATETAIPSATTPPTATVDVTVTAYYATQYALATINAENAAAVETLVAAGLVPTETATPPLIATVAENTVLFTQSSGVRVRACPFISEDCPDVVPELDEAEVVSVTGTTTGDAFRGSSEWYRVEVNGVTGFIHGSLLAGSPPLSEEQTATAAALP